MKAHVAETSPSSRRTWEDFDDNPHRWEACGNTHRKSEGYGENHHGLEAQFGIHHRWGAGYATCALSLFDSR